MTAVHGFLDGVMETLRPPPVLPLSEWADRYFYLSPESAAEPGRWHTLPYQRGIMDAITDPAVERVTVMKSARVGYTKMVNAAIGYYMHQDPCPVMVVQPTVEDAEGYSKEEIAPMLRDCEVLAELIKQPTAKTSESTILAKSFRGGILTMVGANSGRGFRRVSRRVVIFDEVDGYPPSAGTEGDQIKLGERRTEYYWNRKILAGSTPLVAGSSRIEEMFEEGDQRRYYVPCPHCGHMDILTFSARKDGRGHVMQWADGDPESAHFVCRECGSSIEERHKREMIDRGEWRADAPFRRHASFHIWAAYSLSPNASWGQIATEFLDAKRKGPEKLKTFVNTVLGETWREKGEAPDWERLHQRRESYPIGTVTGPVEFLTCGVDVQKDRFVYEVVGWGMNKTSWSVEAGILLGDTSDAKSWQQLDDLLSREFPGEKNQRFQIRMLAIDSGYNTQEVYNWARRYPMRRVIAVKGVSTARTLVGTPTPVDVLHNGKRHARGYKMWPVSVDIAKGQLYGWLRLRMHEDGTVPDGWCHFPEYDAEFFKQLTAEHLVTRVDKRTRRAIMEWQIQPGRQNHYLDCRVYARVAAAVLGLDRVAGRPKPEKSSPPTPNDLASRGAQEAPNAPQDTSTTGHARRPGRWFGAPRPGKGWLGGRRR